MTGREETLELGERGGDEHGTMMISSLVHQLVS